MFHCRGKVKKKCVKKGANTPFLTILAEFRHFFSGYVAGGGGRMGDLTVPS